MSSHSSLHPVSASAKLTGFNKPTSSVCSTFFLFNVVGAILFKLFNRSFTSKETQGNLEIDILVDLAWKIPGVIGSRITGGGFGGCTVSIVKNDSVDIFIESIGKAYKEKVGHEAEFYTVQIGNGASRLNA